MKKYLTFAFLFFSIMILFSSCRQEIKIESTKSDNFKADGYLTDWENIDLIGAEKCNYYFASQYGDSIILLCVSVPRSVDSKWLSKSVESACSMHPASFCLAARECSVGSHTSLRRSIKMG